MIARHKIAGAGIIRGLEFVASGRCVLAPPCLTRPRFVDLRVAQRRRIVTNSSDRVLRQFNLPIYAPPNADGEYIEQELEPTHRFHDPISKVSWHAMSYSPDGEWLAGGEPRVSDSPDIWLIHLYTIVQAPQTMLRTRSTSGILPERVSLRARSTEAASC